MSKDQPALGIIGGGQLGSMLCQAAAKLNIKTFVVADDENSPAQNFCTSFMYSKYTNVDEIKYFFRQVDMITFEFENIPYKILSSISKTKRVLPKPEIIQIVQNRKTEKEFINNLNIKTTKWALIKSKKNIEQNKDLLPGVLKTCTLGYDGKGQHVIKTLEDVRDDWHFSDNFILEKFIDLKKEISVVLTRFSNGEYSIFEPIENMHVEQILKTSKIPADIDKAILEQSQLNTKLIAEKLDYVGTICVEYFIDKNNNLMVNEIAPRVHNSGHLTINAFSVSQFENHIRAVCEIEKIENKKISNAEMINILGSDIENYRKKKLNKNQFFFDYQKKEIKIKRKMGHLTTLK
jgi:5-(carboxyamino)imidazole ribonucleotide synthase